MHAPEDGQADLLRGERQALSERLQAARDAPELLDIDVDQLTGPLALVRLSPGTRTLPAA